MRISRHDPVYHSDLDCEFQPVLTDWDTGKRLLRNRAGEFRIEHLFSVSNDELVQQVENITGRRCVRSHVSSCLQAAEAKFDELSQRWTVSADQTAANAFE